MLYQLFPSIRRWKAALLAGCVFACGHGIAWAAVSDLNFTVTMSEPVTVDTTGGTPRIAVNVGGVTRYANYLSGSGTAALVFSYAPVAGDVDLDGVGISSPVDLNGGSLRDAGGNAAVLTFTPPATAGLKIDYPSMNMDISANHFTRGDATHGSFTALLNALGGTFSRGSKGTYTNAAGLVVMATANVPRFDYDPITHIPKGLLIEEARTNIELNSVTATGRTGFNATLTGNAGTAPDGSAALIKLAATASNVQHGTYNQSSNLTVGQVYTSSIWVKAGGGQGRYISYRGACSGGGSNQAWITFDTQTNSIVANAKVLSSGSIAYPNGFYRIWVTYTADTATETPLVVLSNVSTAPAINNGTGNAFAGTAADFIYFWGGQTELGNRPTSFLSTTTSVAARTADLLTFPSTSLPGWNNGQGTWVATFDRPEVALGGQFVVYAGGPNEFATNQIGRVSTWNGSDEVSAPGDPALRKFASAYDASGRYLSLNGNFNSGTGIYSLSNPTIAIGGDGAGGRALNSTIRAIRYYPARAANAQVQLLSQ